MDWGAGSEVGWAVEVSPQPVSAVEASRQRDSEAEVDWPRPGSGVASAEGRVASVELAARPE